MKRSAIILLSTLLLTGCAIVHVHAPNVDVWVLAPPKAHIEVPLVPTSPPAPTAVIIDSAISDSVWTQLAAIGAGFFALVSKLGWP
jgi:PBP1b-binding outer membrane lipoprotein LpoB